jgi:hypothetical protein
MKAKIIPIVNLVLYFKEYANNLRKTAPLVILMIVDYPLNSYKKSIFASLFGKIIGFFSSVDGKR